jgi:hypothetical protein
MGIRGEKAENLEKRRCSKKMEERSKPAPSQIRGCGIRPTDDDKSPVPGRHSLQAFTDKPPDTIFRAPLHDVMRRATTITPHADERELSIFDSKHEPILDLWMKGGRIERTELFKPVDR